MAEIAREYAWRPVRADILPQAQGVKVGDRVPVRVLLLDASSKLTNAMERTALVVEAVSPSGTTATTNVEVAVGGSSADLTLPAAEAGLTKLIVRQPQNRLMESSNYVLIMSNRPVPAAVVLRVSGERDTSVRADQISYERIAAYYVAAQPAKSPIQVWLTWNHGEVSPNPITIGKGERFAEAHWTSAWPASGAQVEIAAIKPTMPVEGPGATSINFVEPVAGIAFFNPPTTIGIADITRFRARVYDLAGNFIKTSDKRKVAISSSSPIVRFQPQSQDADGDFQTDLIPVGWGTAEIAVATPGYPPFTHTVVVTWLAALWLCIGSGLLAGLVDWAFNSASRGWRLALRLVIATAAALLAFWVYVRMGLPDVSHGIVSRRIVVVAIAVLAGWAAIFSSRKAARMLGFEI